MAHGPPNEESPFIWWSCRACSREQKTGHKSNWQEPATLQNISSRPHGRNDFITLSVNPEKLLDALLTFYYFSTHFLQSKLFTPVCSILLREEIQHVSCPALPHAHLSLSHFPYAILNLCHRTTITMHVWQRVVESLSSDSLLC